MAREQAKAEEQEKKDREEAERKAQEEEKIRAAAEARRKKQAEKAEHKRLQERLRELWAGIDGGVESIFQNPSKTFCLHELIFWANGPLCCVVQLFQLGCFSVYLPILEIDAACTSVTQVRKG